MTVPVITIDGPAASGKGTIAERAARALGFHYLDSGALYRLAALASLEAGIDLSDGPAQVAAIPGVRKALFDLQRNAAEAPGLVADGRDMGTVVFPEAPLKIFMTASAAVRAERRAKQLEARGLKADRAALTRDLEERDRRDRERAAAPLKPAEDAKLLDTSDMTIDEVVKKVLDWWQLVR